MLFLLAAESEADFANAVAATFPDNNIRIGPGQWVLSTNDSRTSQDVWISLVGTNTPTGIIVSFTGYYGLASSNVWEWIAAKRSAQK